MAERLELEGFLQDVSRAPTPYLYPFGFLDTALGKRSRVVVRDSLLRWRISRNPEGIEVTEEARKRSGGRWKAATGQIINAQNLLLDKNLAPDEQEEAAINLGTAVRNALIASIRFHTGTFYFR